VKSQISEYLTVDTVADCHSNQHRDPQYIQSHRAIVNICFWHFQEGFVHICSGERQLADGKLCDRAKNDNVLITTLCKYTVSRVQAIPAILQTDAVYT